MSQNIYVAIFPGNKLCRLLFKCGGILRPDVCLICIFSLTQAGGAIAPVRKYVVLFSSPENNFKN